MRFVAGTVLGLLIAGALWVGAVLFQLGAPTEHSRWHAEIIARKHAIAEATQGPRLVILSGSSGLFGLRAETIERETGMRTVNFGISALLGLDYMIRTGMKVVRPGDTVLFTPEYITLLERGRFREDFIDYVLAREPGYLANLTFVERVRLFFAVPLRRLVQGVQARIVPERVVPQYYDAKTLNAHGDETNNRRETVTPRVRAFLRQKRPEPHWTLHDPDDPAWQRIRDFAAWAKENRVRLLVSYPNYLRFDVYFTEPEKRFFDAVVAFHASLGVPVLGTPEEFMQGPDFFFDLVYHLNDDGAAIATRRMIAHLRPHLAAAPR